MELSVNAAEKKKRFHVLVSRPTSACTYSSYIAPFQCVDSTARVGAPQFASGHTRSKGFSIQQVMPLTLRYLQGTVVCCPEKSKYSDAQLADSIVIT